MGSYKNVTEIYTDLKDKSEELDSVVKIRGYEENTKGTIVEQNILLFFETEITDEVELEIRRLLQGEGWNIRILDDKNVFRVVKTLDLGDVLSMYEISFEKEDVV